MESCKLCGISLTKKTAYQYKRHQRICKKCDSLRSTISTMNRHYSSKKKKEARINKLREECAILQNLIEEWTPTDITKLLRRDF